VSESERVALIDAAVQMSGMHHDTTDSCDGLTAKQVAVRDAACDYLRDLFVRNGTRLPAL
jgi:hypothetical protein